MIIVRKINQKIRNINQNDSLEVPYAKHIYILFQVHPH